MGTLIRRRESLIRSLGSRHGRKESGYCLCEGPRAAREVLTLRPDLVEQVILRTGTVFEADFPVAPDVLPGPEFERLRRTIHSQGVLLVVKRPEALPEAAAICAPFVLLLDRIGDPGNCGTMLRTARAAGLQEVWLTDGTADPFSDKAVRAASGAQFALRVRKHGDLRRTLALLNRQGFCRIYRTTPARGENVFTAPGLFEKSVIILGNEGRGVEAVADAVDLNIPMPGNAESLNVAQAATVILFEYVRRSSGSDGVGKRGVQSWNTGM